MRGWQAAWDRLARPRLGLLLAVAAATALGGAALRARCVGLPHIPNIRLACYSDIVALYELRGLDAKLVPYVQSFNEYPPLTAMWQYATALPVADKGTYWALNAVLLTGVALLVTWQLARMMPRSPRTWLWAAGSPLALYAAYNWDLLPIALVGGAFLCLRKRRDAWAAVLLGLGAAAKWYPAVLAIAVAAWLLRDGFLRAAAFGGVAFGAFVAAHLPFLVLAPQGVVDAYMFHAGRDANWETPWMVVAQVAGGPRPDLLPASWLGVALTASMLTGLGAIAWLAWRRHLGWAAAATAALLVFLLCNKVFSLQYVLWLTPLLVLLRAPVRLVLVLFIADLMANSRVIHLLSQLSTPEFEPAFWDMVPWVLLRHAVLLGLLVWVLLRRPVPSLSPGPPSEGATGSHTSPTSA